MKQKIFWGSVALAFLCINTLSAVLYANVTPLDTGGFISLSPLIDCIVWGFGIAACCLAAFLTRRHRLDRPLKIPDALQFPLAWLGALAGFSLLILILGSFDLFNPYSRLQLPLFVYIIFILSGYPAAGFRFGTKDRSSPFWGVLWAVLLSVLLGCMGRYMLREAALQDAPWQAQIAEGSYIPSGASGLIRHGSYGGTLGRLCLPFCLMFERYYNELTGFSRKTLIMLACLCPTALFTAGWLAGRLKGRSI